MKRKRSSPLIAAGSGYLDALRARYLEDPASTEPGWRAVLEVLEDLDALPANPVPWDGNGEGDGGGAGSALDLIRARGHMAARLDPLARPREGLPPPDMGGGTAAAERLHALYTGPLTIETSHIGDPAVRGALIDLFEGGHGWPDAAERRHALALLTDAEAFEHQLGLRHPTRKRFGAEGAEAVVPLVGHILRQAAAQGVTEVRIGTMHRGRLVLMGTVLGLPLTQLIAELTGLYPFSGGARGAAERAAPQPFRPPPSASIWATVGAAAT